MANPPITATVAVILSLLLGNRDGCHRWNHLVQESAARWGVPPDVIETIIWIESYCDPAAVGASREHGLMQITPGTARYVEAQIGLDADLIMSDPAANVEAGTYYFSLWYHRFDRLDLALSAYNGGPGRVIDSGGVWPPTQRYVDKALAHLGPAWQLGLEPVICARGNEACLEKHDEY